MSRASSSDAHQRLDPAPEALPPHLESSLVSASIAEEETVEPMCCDDAMRQVGGLGCLQQWILFACSTTWFLGAMQLQSYVLYAIPLASQESPSYLTVHDGGVPFHYDRAPTDAECANRHLAPLTVNGDDLVAEHTLICEDATKIPMMGSAVFIGQAVGSFIFPAITDYIGRRLGLRIVMSGVVLAGCLAVFSSSYWMYLAAKAMQGFFAGPAGIIAYIYSSEISCGSSSKSMTIVFFNGAFAMGQVLLVLMSACTSNWRIMETVLLGFSCIGALGMWFVYESPLWLASVGRLEDARQVFVSLAKRNGRIPPRAICEEVRKENPGWSFELFQGYHLRHLILTCLIYIALNFGFYGIAAAASEFGNVYINMLVLATGSAVSLFVCTWAYEQIGRRVTNVTSVCASVAFCGIAIMSRGMLRQIFVQVMTLMLNMSLSGIYVYRAELFATSSRGQAGGVVSFLGKVGGAAGTFISVLAPRTALMLLGVMFDTIYLASFTSKFSICI